MNLPVFSARPSIDIEYKYVPLLSPLILKLKLLTPMVRLDFLESTKLPVITTVRTKNPGPHEYWILVIITQPLIHVAINLF